MLKKSELEGRTERVNHAMQMKKPSGEQKTQMQEEHIITNTEDSRFPRKKSSNEGRAKITYTSGYDQLSKEVLALKDETNQ